MLTCKCAPSSKWPGSSNRDKGYCQRGAVSTRASPTANAPAFTVLLAEQLKKNILFCCPEEGGECKVTDVNFGS